MCRINLKGVASYVHMDTLNRILDSQHAKNVARDSTKTSIQHQHIFAKNVVLARTTIRRVKILCQLVSRASLASIVIRMHSLRAKTIVMQVRTFHLTRVPVPCVHMVNGKIKTINRNVRNVQKEKFPKIMDKPVAQHVLTVLWDFLTHTKVVQVDAFHARRHPNQVKASAEAVNLAGINCQIRVRKEKFSVEIVHSVHSLTNVI